MKKKVVVWALLIFAIIVVIVIIPYIWHPFEETYSLEGTVKSVNISSTGDRRYIYVNFETTDGRVYNFHSEARAFAGETFDNLTRLSEGDKVKLSVHLVGYYFVNSEKKHVELFVKDVTWLK